MKKTGRTLWDYLSEHPILGTFVIVNLINGIVSIIGFLSGRDE